MWLYITKGGPVMIPIILGSLIGMAIIIDRLWVLWGLRLDTAAFAEEVFTLVKSRRITQALERCRRERHPLALVLAAGLEQRAASAAEMTQAMEKMGNRCVRQLEQHLGGLTTVIGISPLLGFLGTITGLIRAFMTWERAGANVTVSSLASGIYEAMITTAAGLIIAIPCYVVYNYLISRIKGIAHELNDYGVELVGRVHAAGQPAHQEAAR